MRQVSSGPNEKRLDHGATLELKKFDKEAAKNHKVRNRLSFWQFLLQDIPRKRKEDQDQLSFEAISTVAYFADLAQSLLYICRSLSCSGLLDRESRSSCRGFAGGRESSEETSWACSWPQTLNSNR